MRVSLRLSVLGSTWDISVDRRSLHDALAAIYHRFVETSTAAGDAIGAHQVTVHTADRPRLEVDGVVRPLSPAVAEPHAFVALNEVMLRGASGCRVLHAAALSRKGRALLVAGPSTYGKSTLAMLLLERGLGFLGDDFAPLDATSGEVRPFPKSIGVRPGVEKLLQAITRDRLERGPTTRFGDKLLVDVDTLFPGALSGPAPVGTVVLLSPPEVARRPDEQVIQIGTAGELPELFHVLAPLGRCEGPEGGPGDPVHLYRFIRQVRDGAVKALAAALDPLRERILFTEKVASEPPDFTREPRLEPCPSTEGLLALAADLLDRQGRAGRLHDPEENAADRLMELAGLLQGARFYRLCIGRFGEMARLVAGLVS